MRTSRCILYTALVTVLAIFYVFQQTEIVKLAYRITSAEKVLGDCRDKKTSLEYLVSSLESPLYLDQNFLQNGQGYEMARQVMLVKADVSTNVKPQDKVVPATLKRFAFANLFAGRQAEAKTIR